MQVLTNFKTFLCKLKFKKWRIAQDLLYAEKCQKQVPKLGKIANSRKFRLAKIECFTICSKHFKIKDTWCWWFKLGICCVLSPSREQCFSKSSSFKLSSSTWCLSWRFSCCVSNSCVSSWMVEALLLDNQDPASPLVRSDVNLLL